MSKYYRLFRYDWPLHFILLITNWLPDNVFFIKLRGRLAAPFLGKCGKTFKLGRDVTFYNPSKINIGDDVYIAKGGWLLGHEQIIIENSVMLGPYVLLVTANHSFENGSYQNGAPVDILPIKIGSGSWISGHCTILPGADMGKGVLIGANSVFRGTAEDGDIFGGVPAKRLKNIYQK